MDFQGNGASLKGYLARPTGPGPRPAVLVIHENRGMLPHFPDVARRLAVEGYAALAVDMLSGEGR
ncbi:MAG: dienelactone hydrolase family protein [Chloroflexota bacterium]|nr:dienelactone hydrolase family protein [Chloroflexota bacterium]